MCQLNYVARNVPYDELQACSRLHNLFGVLENAVANITGGQNMQKLDQEDVLQRGFFDEVRLRARVFMYLPTCLGGMGFADRALLSAPYLAASMESYSHTVRLLQGTVPPEFIKATLESLAEASMVAYNKLAFRKDVSNDQMKAFLSKHPHLSRAPQGKLKRQQLFGGNLSAIPVVGLRAGDAAAAGGVKPEFPSVKIQGVLQARIKALDEIDIQAGKYRHARDLLRGKGKHMGGAMSKVEARKLKIHLCNLSNVSARIFTAIPRSSQGTMFLSSPGYALALQHYMDIRPLALRHTDVRRCAIRHGRNDEIHKEYHSISGCNATELNAGRHDQVCATITDRLAALRVHGTVECNPAGVNFRDRDKKLFRPADIVLCKPHGQIGVRTLMDVTIVDDTQAANNSVASGKEPQKILSDRYAMKIKKYAAVLSQAQGNAVFFPLVFTGRGHVNGDSRLHIQSLFGSVKSRFGYNKTILYHALLDHIVFDIARGAVAQIQTHADVEARSRASRANDGAAGQTGVIHGGWRG